jgi:hypothetical protein
MFVIAERFISKLVVVLVTSGFPGWRYMVSTAGL